MASGDTLAAFDALAARPPLTGYAQLDLRNAHVVLDFDPAAPERADFFGVLPAAYSRGGMTARLTWTSSTATSGDTRWCVLFERHAVGDAQLGSLDLDADAFGPGSAVSAVAPSAAGALRRCEVSIPWAQASHPAPGESFRLRVERLANDPADTMAGDAELLLVELREA